MKKLLVIALLIHCPMVFAKTISAMIKAIINPGIEQQTFEKKILVLNECIRKKDIIDQNMRLMQSSNFAHKDYVLAKAKQRQMNLLKECLHNLDAVDETQGTLQKFALHFTENLKNEFVLN